MKKITFGSIFVFFAAMLFMTGCSDSANNNGKIPDELKGKVYFKAERKNFEKSSKAGESRISFTQKDEDNITDPIITSWQEEDIIYLYKMNADGTDGSYAAQFNAIEVASENSKIAYFVIDEKSKDVKFQEGSIYKAIARTGDKNGWAEQIPFKQSSYNTVVAHINSYDHVNEGEFLDNGTLSALGCNYVIYSDDNLLCKITTDKVVSFENKDKSNETNYISFKNPYVLITLNVKMPSEYNEATDGKIDMLGFNVFTDQTGNVSDSYQVSFDDTYTYDATKGITVHFFILPKTYYNFSVAVTANNYNTAFDRQETNNAAKTLEAGFRYVFEISGGGNWEEYEGVYLWMLTDTFKSAHKVAYDTNLERLQTFINGATGNIEFLDDSNQDPKVASNAVYNPSYATYKVDKTAWRTLRDNLASVQGEKTYWLSFRDMKDGFDQVDNKVGGNNENYGLLAGNNNVYSISAPNATGSIGAYAFDHCSKLAIADMPNITAVEDYGFSYCSVLEDIPAQKNMLTVGAYAFQNCIKITSANMPECTTVGSRAFENCYYLTTFIFPKVTTFGTMVFSGASNYDYNPTIVIGTEVSQQAQVSAGTLFTKTFSRATLGKRYTTGINYASYSNGTFYIEPSSKDNGYTNTWMTKIAGKNPTIHGSFVNPPIIVNYP